MTFILITQLLAFVAKTFGAIRKSSHSTANLPNKTQNQMPANMDFFFGQHFLRREFDKNQTMHC